MFLDIGIDDITKFKIDTSYLNFNLNNIRCFNPFCTFYNKTGIKYYIDFYKSVVELSCLCDCEFNYVIKSNNIEEIEIFNYGIDCWKYIRFNVRNNFKTISEMSDFFYVDEKLIENYLNKKRKRIVKVAKIDDLLEGQIPWL